LTGPRPYEIHIKSSAEREMDALPKPMFTRVSRAILQLESAPRPRGAKKLRGRSAYRLRVGSYRVLYTIDNKLHVVEIIAVGHRRDVYR